MLIKPKPGSRLGENDPLCHTKSTQDLTSLAGHENYATAQGREWEERREHVLLSHCQDKYPVPQTDDVSMEPEMIRRDFGPERGGPVTSDRKL